MYRMVQLSDRFQFLVGEYYDKGAYLQEVFIVDSSNGRIKLVCGNACEGYIGGLYVLQDTSILFADAILEDKTKRVYRIDMETLDVVCDKSPFEYGFGQTALAEDALRTFMVQLVGPNQPLESIKEH